MSTFNNVYMSAYVAKRAERKQEQRWEDPLLERAKAKDKPPRAHE
jgi:hypothetical protein